MVEDTENSVDEVFNIREVDLASMNTDQQFAFNIIMQTVFPALKMKLSKHCG